MKQSTTLGATLACAQAIKLSSRAEIIPGLPSFPTIPDIPIISDIPDVVNVGIDYIDTGITDFGDLVIDGIDVTIGALEPTVTSINADLIDFGELVYDDAIEPIGDMGEIIFEPIGPEFDHVTDFVVDDIGSVVIDDVGGFIVDDYMGAMDDVYDWTTSKGNWEALGKTVLIGYKHYFDGDFEGAAEVWLNEEHYTEEFWDQLERDRIAAEEAARIAEENK